MAAGEGLVTMRPTSISFTGTSASINATGGVDFSSVTVLSLNGVFTNAHDNYRMVISVKNTLSQDNVLARLRASGSDATAANYTRQYLFVTGTTRSGARSTSETYLYVGGSDDALWSGDHTFIYGPYLAQPTVTRNVNVTGELSGYLQENACIHSLSNSYDGLTLFLTAGSQGSVHIFGYEE